MALVIVAFVIIRLVIGTYVIMAVVIMAVVVMACVIMAVVIMAVVIMACVIGDRCVPGCHDRLRTWQPPRVGRGGHDNRQENDRRYNGQPACFEKVKSMVHGQELRWQR